MMLTFSRGSKANKHAERESSPYDSWSDRSGHPSSPKFHASDPPPAKKRKTHTLEDTDMELSDIRDFNHRRLTTRLQSMFTDKPVAVLYKALLSNNGHFEGAVDHLSQEDFKENMLFNSYAAYHHFSTLMQKLERLEGKEQECDDLKRKLEGSQAAVRIYQNANRLLKKKIREDALTSAARIDELELRLAGFDYKYKNSDRYKRKTEIAVRLSNTYRDLQALEQTKEDKLEIDLEANKQSP